MKKRWKWSNLYLAIMILLMYFPLVMVVIFSFNESRLSANFTGFSLKWYETLANDRDLKEVLFNSILLGVLSCGISAIIGTLGAVGMARVKYKTKGMMEYLSTIPIMIPEIILGMVFLVFFSMLNLPFGMTTLVIAHTTFCIPYIFMMVKARLVGIDKSLEEAARDLGAGPIRTFFDITMPLIAPAVLSGSLLAFAMSFDDVVISIFVNGPRLNTLPVKVYAQLKTGVTPEINALCTIILVVITAVLLLSSFLSKRAEKKY
ncbi:MAG: ABC transporter permease [Blautia sp.]|nr:ABC transporter permease [Blautia sp.]